MLSMARSHGKQRIAVILEHVGDLRLADGLPVVKHSTGVDRHEAGNHVDQGALAATIGAEDGNEFRHRQFEAKIVVNHAVAEILRQPANGDERLPVGGGSHAACPALPGRALPLPVLPRIQGERLPCSGPRDRKSCASALEVRELQYLFTHVDRRFEDTFVDEDIDECLIGIHIDFVQVMERTQIGLGEKPKLLRP